MRSKPPPSSGIAHNFFTWLHHVTGAGPHRHRIVSAPPLPRPRPAQLAKVPVEQPAAALEPKKAQPAATAVQPNNAPGAAERDRAPAPAVKSNEAQPAAALMPSAPAPALSQIRQRPKYRPERLSRLRRHRAPQQELRSREPIFQTDFTLRRAQDKPAPAVAPRSNQFLCKAKLGAAKRRRRARPMPYKLKWHSCAVRDRHLSLCSCRGLASAWMVLNRYRLPVPMIRRVKARRRQSDI